MHPLQHSTSFPSAHGGTTIDRSDEPFSAAAERTMAAWQADNPPGKFGEHTYGKDDFGLTAGAIHERFADYVERFFPDLGSGAGAGGAPGRGAAS